jgi:hypothetical protein
MKLVLFFCFVYFALFEISYSFSSSFLSFLVIITGDVVDHITPDTPFDEREVMFAKTSKENQTTNINNSYPIHYYPLFLLLRPLSDDNINKPLPVAIKEKLDEYKTRCDAFNRKAFEISSKNDGIRKGRGDSQVSPLPNEYTEVPPSFEYFIESHEMSMICLLYIILLIHSSSICIAHLGILLNKYDPDIILSHGVVSDVIGMVVLRAKMIGLFCLCVICCINVQIKCFYITLLFNFHSSGREKYWWTGE